MSNKEDSMAKFISSLLWTLKDKDIPYKKFYMEYPYNQEYLNLVNSLLPEPVEETDRAEFDDIVRQSILITIETFDYMKGKGDLK